MREDTHLGIYDRKRVTEEDFWRLVARGVQDAADREYVLYWVSTVPILDDMAIACGWGLN